MGLTLKFDFVCYTTRFVLSISGEKVMTKQLFVPKSGTATLRDLTQLLEEARSQKGSPLQEANVQFLQDIMSTATQEGTVHMGHQIDLILIVAPSDQDRPEPTKGKMGFAP
jgi:hypothetical protein